jgi:hypothetical protein
MLSACPNQWSSIPRSIHHDDFKPTLEEWGKLLSDVPATGAILDRLLHHAEIISINGRSYRLKSTLKQPPSKKT